MLTYNHVDASLLRSSNLAVRIPAILRKLRQQKGLKLSDIAKLCETTPQSIQRLETGGMSMSLEWLDKICKALGVEDMEIFQVTRAEEMQAEAEKRARERVVGDLRAYADRLEEGRLL